MDIQSWIALAGLAVVVFVQGAAGVWWAASVSADVKALKEASKGAADLRDIVIELRSDVKNFGQAVKDLSDAIKPKRRSSSVD